MSEPLRVAVLAVEVFLALLIIYLLARSLINSAAEWLDNRSDERSQRIERELVKTRKRLALVSEAQANLMDTRAHEAAVELIMESYRASQETGDKAP